MRIWSHCAGKAQGPSVVGWSLWDGHAKDEKTTPPHVPAMALRAKVATGGDCLVLFFLAVVAECALKGREAVPRSQDRKQ